MPPAKKSTTKRAPSRAKTNRPANTALSPTHKKALAAGRTESAVVNRYLSAVNTPRKRGRKVSAAALRTRLQAAEERARTAIGVDRVVAYQEIRDLQVRLSALAGDATADMEKLEQEFCKVAKGFSERRGISYRAWRDAGVTVAVLKKAGIARSRGASQR